MAKKPDTRPSAKDRARRMERVEQGLPAAMSPEERAAVSRQNGMNGGRELGFRDILPRGTIPAIQNMKFRVKGEYAENPLACQMAGAGLAGIIKVLNGQVHSRRAPSVLKAALALRAEVCEPVVQESNVKVGLSLSAAIAEANAKLGPEQQQDMLPAASQIVLVPVPDREKP